MLHIINLKHLSRSLLTVFLLLGAAHGAEPTFLKASEAYRFNVDADADAIAVTYHVAEGYYLYRKRFGFETDTPGVTLGTAAFPKGQPHSDDYFGVQEIFRDTFTVRLPYRRTAEAEPVVSLTLKLQGCADAGLCYPPQTYTARVALPDVTASPPRSPARVAASTPAPRDLLAKLVRPQAVPRADVVTPEFLPADQAFRASATAEDRAVRVRVAIAPGYYLYRDRFRFLAASPTRFAAPQWPAGEVHHDDYFGDQTVFRGDVDIRVPLTGDRPTQLDVTYQGCADAGLCYTPQTVHLTLSPEAGGANPATASEQDLLTERVRSAPLWAVFGSFWFFGLLLAFTPCVLPMVPILAGVIAGDGPAVSTRRAFTLSVAYVSGMAVTYTGAGVAFAAAGARSQAIFQQPWVIGLFAALFVVLAVAMFGGFELALPSALQTRIANASGRIRGGRLASTALLGALSSLIVTACVAPPLVATFVVIGQVGAVGRGALALGALSIGMGTPLLLVGASAGRLLPKSGPWMATVKALFGVVFLGVAVWMLDRIVPPVATQAGWAVVAAAAATVLYRTGRPTGRSAGGRRVLAAAIGLYAVVLLSSSLLGGADPLHPTRGTRFGAAAGQALTFRPVRSTADLDREIAEARNAGQPVMLDFSADWCVSCKEMDAHTFNDPNVLASLARYRVLRADVTANSPDDRALLERFGIVGPPTTAFIKPDGDERRAFRLVGFVAPATFLHHLRAFEAAP